jgi:hypothetical protein
MTSFFGERMRGFMGRRPGLLLTLTLTLALGLTATATGCREPQMHETPVELTRDPDGPCVGPQGGPLLPMDTYVVQLYWVIDPARLPEGRLDCEQCVRDPELCRLDREQCRCGGPTETSPRQLGTMLAGLRFEGVEADTLYCVRVIALEDGGLGPPEPDRCACDPVYTDPGALATSGRLCAMSSPRDTSPLELRLEVRCPGDRYGDRQGGGSFFDDCLGIARTQ